MFPCRCACLRRTPWHQRLRVALLLLTGWWGMVLGCAAAAAGQPPVVEISRMAQSPLSLTEHLAVLEDPTQSASLADVQAPALAARFRASLGPAESLSFGITASAYWFRVVLRNDDDQPLERLLEIAYARLSHVELHRPLPGGGYQALGTGATAPFDSRPYANRFFVFPLTLPAHAEQTYYLRVRSTTAFIVPARLWTPQAFHLHERNDYLAQAWYFGMAAAMILFNLLMFARLRDVLYLLYVGFALSMSFALASQNGLVKEFARLQSPLWSDLSTTFGYSITIAMGMLFMRRMLEMATLMPRTDRLFKLLVLFFFLSPVVFLFSGQAFIQTAALVYIAAVVLMIVVAFRCAWLSQRSAYFFLAAFLLLGLGAITNTLRAIGLVPTHPITVNAMQLGAALEMLLLSFALADRFDQIRRDKNRIQGKLLLARQQLIDNLQHAERRLEQRVAERTQELGELNARLAALSMTDSLTGLANRRQFDEALRSEWERARRTGQPLALLMLDVDHFKRYNDLYGHLAGDECLQRVAAVLGGAARRGGDLVARFGGEEFALILPNTDGASARLVAEQIIHDVQALGLPHAGSGHGCVTLSVGVACTDPGAGGAPDSLIHSADVALYRAKGQGRNGAALAAGAPASTAGHGV